MHLNKRKKGHRGEEKEGRNEVIILSHKNKFKHKTKLVTANKTLMASLSLYAAE